MEQVAEGLSDGLVSELARYSRSTSGVRGSRDNPSAFQRLLDDELNQFEDYLSDHLRSEHASVTAVMDSVAALQGKRLRPRLVYLSALACGGVGPETRRVAAVVELVHAATLVHDDVLDGSDFRRNTPAAHIAWGNHRSILLGDILFSKAYLLAAGAGSCVVAQRVGQAGLALCEGELRQQASIGQWDLAVAEYVDILRQKTGDLCAASSYLGAWSAGASIERQRALEEYGLQLGIAFQIFDDWLDVWGTASVGKPLGNDVANRKPTLPSLRMLAANQHDPVKRAELVSELERGQLSDPLRLAMERSGASEATLELARRHAMAACDALSGVADSPAKQALIQVAQQSVRRVR